MGTKFTADVRLVAQNGYQRSSRPAVGGGSWVAEGQVTMICRSAIANVINGSCLLITFSMANNSFTRRSLSMVRAFG